MILLRFLILILNFWFPLLLTAKAFQRPDDGTRFLLTYWVLYACVANAQYYFHHHERGFSFDSLIVYLGDFVLMWMFYSHGCLVITHYYLPSLFRLGTGGASTIDELDFRLFDPLVNLAVVRNPFLQGLIGLFPTRILPIDDLMAFNNELCRHFRLSGKRLSFLQFGVEYFCYMDTSSELHVRYLRCRRFLLGLNMLGLPPRKRRVRSGSSTFRAPTPPQDQLYAREEFRTRLRANSAGLRTSQAASGSTSPPVNSPRMAPVNNPSVFADIPSVSLKVPANMKYGGMQQARRDEQPRSVSGPELETAHRAADRRSVSSGSPPYPVASGFPY